MTFRRASASFAHAIAALIAATCLSPFADAWELAPRATTPPAMVRALPFPPDTPVETRGYRLNVKFLDEARVRAVDGSLRSGSSLDLAPVLEVAARHRLTFRPALPWEEAKAAALQGRAEARTGVGQPDLLGIHYVAAPGETPALLEEIGAALQALPLVEYAYIEHLGVPPPGDIAPTTPDLSGNQG